MENIDVMIICPVRNGTPSGVLDHVKQLEELGLKVYLPPRDTPQDDPTGEAICQRTLEAIKCAKEIHVWYSSDSQGCHWDCGSAYALGKKMILINPDEPDRNGKSYMKVIKSCG